MKLNHWVSVELNPFHNTSRPNIILIYFKTSPQDFFPPCNIDMTACCHGNWAVIASQTQFKVIRILMIRDATPSCWGKINIILKRLGGRRKYFMIFYYFPSNSILLLQLTFRSCACKLASIQGRDIGYWGGGDAGVWAAIYHQLRARRALTLLKDVPLRTRRGLSL